MMGWLRNKLRAVLDGYEARGLERSELTLVLPLTGDSSALREHLLQKLRELDRTEPSPLSSVPSLHQARFLVREDALVMSCVHDGDALDLLHELFEHAGEALDPVLAHCVSYPGSADRDACVQQLMAARVPTGYFFSDSDASKSEVVRALELRTHFVDFVIRQQRATDSELERAFDRFRSGRWPDRPARSKPPGPRARARASARTDVGAPIHEPLGFRLDSGTPLLRPFERPLPDEQYWVRRLAELARVRARRELRENAAPSHADLAAELLRATFSVRDDVPSELQHGVFLPGQRYAAWLRISRGAGGLQRGVELAIKLERVGAYGHLLDVGLPEVTAAACQDFVLSEHETFFARDLRDYTVLRSILDTRDPSARARRLAVFALRRPRESWIAARRFLRRSPEPLEGEYHSTMAFALGPQLAVKYCVTPALQPSTADAPDSAGIPLLQRLDPSHGESFALDFCAIVPARDVLPVEDPRIAWTGERAHRVAIARIEIEPQDLHSAERKRLAEALSFSPWHTLEAHRPLGGFNRARLEIDRWAARLQLGAAAEEPAVTAHHVEHAHAAAGYATARTGVERRSSPPSYRASAERRSGPPQARSRSSAPPADRGRAHSKSVRPPARRKRNRSVH
jgi:hypothetical protein